MPPLSKYRASGDSIGKSEVNSLIFPVFGLITPIFDELDSVNQMSPNESLDSAKGPPSAVGIVYSSKFPEFCSYFINMFLSTSETQMLFSKSACNEIGIASIGSEI